MSGIESIQHIWTPDASVLTSTDQAEKQAASAAESAPPVDPATQPGIAEADGGPGIYADNTGNGQYSSGTGNVGRWDVAQSIREFFDSAFGTSLNARILPPHDNEWIG